MFDLDKMFYRELKYIIYLVAFYVLGWGFTPYKPVFLGLAFGTCLSLFLLWTMVSKNRKLTKAAMEGTKMKSVGTLSRMATAALAVSVALQFPDALHLGSVIIGLMTIYFVIIIDFFIQHLRQK
ncbi:ATP synthase subunit I [Peribacillus deserti]|uniref:ATP synthase subunit n=1 Tax=Peribacillus deserti TaxID=673318 RepID=A0A2N5MBH2_9BACI|nr:ATP synthase subunit I [Peribacillus deserti]PLT31696.1 ATP synthase subunit [Peribacillus deserti]